MSGFQGSISYTNPPGAPQGFINVAGARNGLSVDASQFIVLGQPAGTGAGGPAQLLNNREIPIGTGIPPGSSKLNFGVPADNTNFSFITFNTTITAWQDQRQAATPPMIIIPPNNISLTSVSGGFITINPTYSNTDPLGGGDTSNYVGSATWTPTAGTSNFHNFEAGINAVPTGGLGDIVMFESVPQLNATIAASGVLRGFFHRGTITNLGGFTHVAIENFNGNNNFNSGNTAGGFDPGRSSFHQSGADPTAFVHIGPSLGTAGEGPLKLTPGPLLPGAGAEQGLFEFDSLTNGLFFTPTAANREVVHTGNSGAAAPGTHVGVALLNFFGQAGGGAVYLATPDSWASVNFAGTTFKIPLYV